MKELNFSKLKNINVILNNLNTNYYKLEKLKALEWKSKLKISNSSALSSLKIYESSKI